VLRTFDRVFGLTPLALARQAKPIRLTERQPPRQTRPHRVDVEIPDPAKGGEMGDRTKRLKGKTEEIKGRTKRDTGRATGRPGTEARGAGEELKGKTKNAAGRASSGIKKATR
jgi:uncharacterized protein YjbJ (UPF0337 family)